jgi:hypothetical protein
MDAVSPTVLAIQDIESRQDEVLRKLDELEQRVLKALKEFGGEPVRSPKMTIPFGSAPDASVPAVKAA